MSSQKYNRKQKTITHGNKKYLGVLRNGKLTVKVDQTAKGQLLTAGTYDVANSRWEKGCRKAPLPARVQQLFEEAFGLTQLADPAN